jgi:hypothetical protein
MGGTKNLKRPGDGPLHRLLKIGGTVGREKPTTRGGTKRAPISSMRRHQMHISNHTFHTPDGIMYEMENGGLLEQSYYYLVCYIGNSLIAPPTFNCGHMHKSIYEAKGCASKSTPEDCKAVLTKLGYCTFCGHFGALHSTRHSCTMCGGDEDSISL